MKKYLSLAALLGLIAFVSVSYLAQAQNETSQAKTAIEEAMKGNEPSMAEGAETPANVEADAVSPEVAKFMQSVEACEGILAAEAEKMETSVTQEQHDEAFTACMVDHGHTKEEVKARYFDTEPAVPDVMPAD